MTGDNFNHWFAVIAMFVFY